MYMSSLLRAWRLSRILGAMLISRCKLLPLIVAVCLALGPCAWAQGTTGTVMGHVTAGDTQRPARFAQVILFGVPTEITNAPKTTDSTDPAQLAAAMKTTLSSMSSMKLVQTMTGFDGAYTAKNVAPGDYYVFASIPGYLQPIAQVQALYEAGADLSKPLPGIPMVHVGGGTQSIADVTVDRGAAISGKAVWDDGSPVPHASIQVIAPKDKSKELPPQFSMLAMGAAMGGGLLLATTDDLGHFRIAGLAPGDYMVKASLQTQSQFVMNSGQMNMSGLLANTPLVVYAPAAFHQADAAVVTLHAGDEASDRDVTFNLVGLHTVSGHVASAEDHHSLNSGRVRVEDAKDKDFSRSAAIDANGNYTVTFVPAGTYNMTITGSDTEAAKGGGKGGIMSFSSDHTLKSYQQGTQSVVVTDSDVTGQDMELKPSSGTAKDVNLGDILLGTSPE